LNSTQSLVRASLTAAVSLQWKSGGVLQSCPFTKRVSRAVAAIRLASRRALNQRMWMPGVESVPSWFRRRIDGHGVMRLRSNHAASVAAARKTTVGMQCPACSSDAPGMNAP
jgi:hypothetical protein